MAHPEYLLEEFADLLELQEEYADGFDPDDIEARVAWEEVQARMRLLSKRMKKLRKAADFDGVDLDEIEQLIEEVNDAFGELAVMR